MCQKKRFPGTQRPVGKKRVYDVFRNLCYDEDPAKPWKHQKRLQGKALTQRAQERRAEWAEGELEGERTDAWFMRHCVWTDVCSSVLPRTEQKAAEQALARKGSNGWISDDAKGRSTNLQGRKEPLKQSSFGTLKLYWAPLLARGKLHVIPLPRDFPGDTAGGAAILATKLVPALKKRFPGSPLPKNVFTDRGLGFFHPNGAITAEWQAGLTAAGLRAYQGDDAGAQPGQVGDVLLHETAVSWLRAGLTATTPASPETETEEEYYARLQEVCADANKRHDVEGLCKVFRARLAKVVEKEGDAIGK